MGKHIKLRIPLLLPCSPSSSSSSFPVQPVPIKRHLSSSSASVGCDCRQKPKQPSTIYQYNMPDTPLRRIYSSPLSKEESSNRHVSASPAFRNKSKQKTLAEAAWFSSEETSGDFSTDSNCSSITETPISGFKNKKKKKPANIVKRAKYYGNSKVTPVGKKVTCNTPETKESLVVMKKSEDPYGDFRRSMMEMIMDRENFETTDLEQLLQCFLSLNSRHHYGVIIDAFADIWEILFCKSTVM